MSTTSTEKIDLFCNILEEFLNNLYDIHPDNSLYLLIGLTATMKYVTPTQIVIQFMRSVKPYEAQIINKDESFFFETDILETHWKNSSLVLREINKIKSIWNDPETTQDTRDIIWMYFNNLILIGNNIDIVY